jgi:hypothetical protein
MMIDDLPRLSGQEVRLDKASGHQDIRGPACHKILLPSASCM